MDGSKDSIDKKPDLTKKVGFAGKSPSHLVGRFLQPVLFDSRSRTLRHIKEDSGIVFSTPRFLLSNLAFLPAGSGVRLISMQGMNDHDKNKNRVKTKYD